MEILLGESLRIISRNLEDLLPETLCEHLMLPDYSIFLLSICLSFYIYLVLLSASFFLLPKVTNQTFWKEGYSIAFFSL